MNILAIDYGVKNIGLAWTQTGLDVVMPFGVVNNLKELVLLIKKEKIDKVIIGLPLGLDGKENNNTKKVRQFSEDLNQEINLSIEFVDERFTSAGADRFGSEGASRDEKAAMLILQTYLEKK